MNITISSIPMADASVYKPTMDGYKNHLTIKSVEELQGLESIVKKDIHAYKLYNNDSRKGLFLGYDEKGKETFGPVQVLSMAGVVFDIDKDITIEKFESLDICNKYIYVIYASKSHNIDKDDALACDRFHIFFPFENDSTNCDEIITSCRALAEEFKDNKLKIDTTVTVDKARLIYPSRQSGATSNEHFFFRVVSENRTFITEKYLAEYVTRRTMKAYDTALVNYSSTDVQEQEYLKAVEYLKTRKYSSYNQWLAAATSLKIKFGDEQGLALFIDLSNNANYDKKESDAELTRKFQGLSTDAKYEKAIFAVANEIAVASGDSIRFLTHSKIIPTKAIKNTDFDTAQEYTGENYMSFFNDFIGLAPSGNVWVKYSFNNTWELMKTNEIRQVLKPFKTMTESLDEKGKKKTVILDAFEQWLGNMERRLIHKVVLDVDQLQKKNVINLFTGYAVDPIECELDDIKPFTDYIYNILASGNKEVAQYIFNYMAAIVQLKKNPHALILKGEQGAGKSTLTDVLVKILGRDFTSKIQHKDHLVGKFNSHLANKVLVYMEEAMLTTKKDKDNAIDDTLKTLITEDTIKIEYKGGATIDIDNRINIIMTTNHDFPVNIEKGDRRYVIVEVSDSKAQDNNYFDALYSWFRDEGYSKILYVMQNFPANMKMAIPKTEARKDSMLNSLRSEEKFIVELFRNNGKMTVYGYDSVEAIEMNLIGRVATDLLYNKYAMWCHMTKTTPIGNQSFGMKVAKVLKVKSKVDSYSKRYYDIDVDACKDAINSYYKTNMFSDLESESFAPIVKQQIVEVQAEPVKVVPQPVSLFTEPKPEPQIASPVVESAIVVQTSTPVVKQAAMTVPATVDLNELAKTVVPGARLKIARENESEISFDKDTEVMFRISAYGFSKYYVLSTDASKNVYNYTVNAAATITQCN